MQTIKFCFGSTAISICFKFGQILGLFHFLNSSRLLFFLPVGAVFWVEVRLENIFGTYKCRLSIFVLKVQPYLLVFHSAKFWAFLHFLGSLGLFFGFGSGSKTFLEPTNNVGYQFLFRKYSPIFLFLIRPNFGPFCTFWALRGYLFLACWVIFGVKVRFKIIFGTY